MGYHIPPLEVRKVVGGWSAYPPSVATGEELTIYGNYVDASPRITIDGNNAIYFYGGGASYLGLTQNGGLPQIFTASGQDLLIAPDSGIIRVGTFTSDATVTQSGYITIKDIGGTTRYLSCITP